MDSTNFTQKNKVSVTNDVIIFGNIDDIAIKVKKLLK